MNRSSTPESGMGRALKRVFHQDDYMRKVEEQPARVSFLMNDVRRSIFIHLCANPCNLCFFSFSFLKWIINNMVKPHDKLVLVG